MCLLDYKRKSDLIKHEKNCQGNSSNPPIVKMDSKEKLDERERKLIAAEALTTADLAKARTKVQKLETKLGNIQSCLHDLQTAATQPCSGNIYHLPN